MATSVNYLDDVEVKRFALECEIDEKRNRYLFWKKLFESPERQESLLSDITRNAEFLKAELAKLPPICPNIRDIPNGAAQVAALVNWLNTQFNMSQPLTAEQQICIVDMIVADYGGLRLEDIAQCFKDLMKSANTQYRLDTPSVIGFIEQYKQKRQQEGHLNNINKHLTTK